MHRDRLRAEISRSKAEQGEYLKNVELARVLEKRRVKDAAKGADTGSATSKIKGKADSTGSTSTRVPKKGLSDDRKNGYTQRQSAKSSNGAHGGMGSVLGSVFG
jgi:ESF2/ABP1 family protein